MINDTSINQKILSINSPTNEKILHPFVVSNADMTSFTITNTKNININNNIKINNNKINEIEEKEDKILDIKKDENKKSNPIGLYSPIADNIFELENRERPQKTSNDHISLSIKKLSDGDDMDILNELMSLCNFLSLSSERIGYNPNMAKLLEEICKNLTKTYLPEIIIYSLQCINYILDINPTLSFVLKKINGISSIMNTISCIEDISCVDYIIKIFDKISTENTRILLENNVFESFLVNIFDFLNIHQKKSLMKICYNITLRRINIDEYNKYIKPSMNVLINLIKIDDDDNNDNLFIVEKAINIFYNTINFIKYGEHLYNKEKKEENPIKELITNYKIIENFIEILNKFFIKNNQIITEQLIRIILKTIVLILQISKEGMDKILSNKFLEIISDIINNEFNTDLKTYNNNINNNNNIIINRRKNSNATKRRGLLFLFEFFDILIALFPSWKSNDLKDKKILNPENKIYYDYFCQNILLPLINNIRNKSTNKLLTNFIKLILAFINNANKNDIILYLPSKPISQIIINLLDTKNNTNIIDSISLIQSLLEKVPENYIVNFVREGIVHTLKNYKFETKKIEIKDEIININDKKYQPLPKIKKGIEFISKDNKSKENTNDKNNDKNEKELSIINNEQIKDDNKEFNKDILELNKNDKNNDSKLIYNKIELINEDELEKDKNKDLFKDKDMDIINNFKENIKISPKIISTKEKVEFINFNEIINEENELKIGSEVENEEDDHEDEEENNDKSENEEKEQEEEEENSFISKNKSNFNSSYSEEKDKNEDIENSSKKEKENDKDINFNYNFIQIKNQTQKETQIKKFDLFEEISNNSNKNSDDINKKDILWDNKSVKEEKIEIIKNDIKKEDIKNDDKIKFENIKKQFINTEEKYKDIIKKKRIKDLIKNKIKYNELEDNIYSLEIKTVQEKIKYLLTNYLTDEKISQYLSNTENKTKDCLIKIQTTLSNYQQLLSSTNNENKDKDIYIKEIIDILTDEKISITLFELENSKILLSLSNYFEPKFTAQYNKLIDDNEYDSIDKLLRNISDKKLFTENYYNFDIFEKISKFFENCGRDKNKIVNFIKLLNESIQAMNCPIFLLNENKRSIIDRFEIKSIKRNHTIKLKMDYNEQVFKDDVLNSDLVIDNNYKTKLCEINMFFKTNQRMMLVVNDNTTFKNMSINLLSSANIPLIANDKYDIYFKYSIKNNKNKNNIEKKDDNNEKMDIEEINDNNKDVMKKEEKDEKEEVIHIADIETNNEQKENEIFDINENWTYKHFLENYSENNKIEIPFFIQFGLSIKPKNNEQKNIKNENTENINIINIQNENENIINDKSKGFLEHYSPFIKDGLNIINHINFDKYCFIKDYHNNIIYSKSIYFSKRLMPSLYLLSLLNMCINKYNELFNLPKIWFINNDKNKNEWKKLFYNLKIDQFILKISLDPYKVSNTPFPFLGEYIAKNNQTLIKFHTRLLSFKTSFSSSYKSLINLQNHLKHNNPNYTSKYSITLKKTMRLKINVERDKIIEHGFNLINDQITSKFKGYLEFEYNGEIGNGLGPTLEFYTLIIDKIKENSNLWYKTTDGSLYPKLLSDYENNDSNLKLFKLLGFIIGRAIYDDRLLDIPLSKCFWNLVLDKPLLFKNIKIIDLNLYKTLLDFVNLINEKNEYIKKNNIERIENINFDNIILYNNCKLSELDIYFIFPGYNNIELKPNGNDILLTMNNIEEYVNLIYDYLFYRGIEKVVNNFKEGFNMNFNVEKLKCFTSSEIEEYICGSVDTKWDKNVLFDNLKPEHGYTNQSKTFNDLIKFMCGLDKNQRRKFLTFTTGSSRLPIGGFKSLSPKLTVVKKHCEEGNNPDDYLPTVMTCQNYLKLPEYSSYNILEKKILLAIKEGCNEFNLS